MSNEQHGVHGLHMRPIAAPQICLSLCSTTNSIFLQKPSATADCEVDNSRNSLLWFAGPLEVQGVFEYLYNGQHGVYDLHTRPVAISRMCAGSVCSTNNSIVLQKPSATAGREVDNSRESLLWFEGPLEVQGLFEYLFNEQRKVCGEECDVPVLLAPTAFPGACLKQTRPKVK